MITQILRDGQKNCSILVKGFVDGDFEPMPILDVSKLERPREGWKGLRLDSAAWVVQEKMGFNLWWSKPEKEDDLIFPMESRNSMRLDEGLPSPRMEGGWRGILYLSSFRANEATGPKSFMFILDFDKQ